ncbi:YHYH protein [Octadecabacter sp. G9-8]|uniref:YHYH protein n=2 Tax=Octadecabacter dasysiphoniae TaxID=2909341 RepID=A0ABS9D318_9RHOB|nr:YHYH protein [Octadecabacter dasysiphoniae]
MAQAENHPPADANWIMNDGSTSLLVVREPQGPPPGLDLPEGVVPPPPQVMDEDDILGAFARVNVLEVENTGDYTRIKTAYVPEYEVLVTQDMMDQLLARPKFETDFPDGVLVSVGDTVRFGQDIGYSGDTCTEGAGLGFWPPATFCATGISIDNFIPNTPEPTEDICYTTLADVGIFMNGTVLFNWSDGQSYGAQGDWHNMAHIYEAYDFDICQGHAVEGMYHHHGYSQCLNDAIGDTGDGHSPIWGYAADGFAIHGPWHDAGVLAQSSWRVRDYASEAEGCGEDGDRSCIMNDLLNPMSGTRPVSQGPAVGEFGKSMFSQNDIVLENGAFFEDYVFDAALQTTPASLDAYNGHDHDGLGYHYHITTDASMNPVFPYSFGPMYRGRLHDNAITSCGATAMEFPAGPISEASNQSIDLGDAQWTVLIAD